MALEEFNDAKYRTLGVSHSGSIDDRMRSLIDTNVGREESERAHWLFLYPAGEGTLNDIKRQYFKSLGFTQESLQDMEHAYWQNLSP